MKDRLYFFDHNVGKPFVKVLRTLGMNNVMHLTERYKDKTEDEVFLPFVAQKGWILVTSDYDMHEDESRRLILCTENVTALFLPEKVHHYSLWNKAHWLLHYLPRIDSQEILLGNCYEVSIYGVLKPIDLVNYRRRRRRKKMLSALLPANVTTVEFNP